MRLLWSYFDVLVMALDMVLNY